MIEKFYLEDNETEKSTSSLIKVGENKEKFENSNEISLETSRLESNLENLESDIKEMGGEAGLQEELDNNESFKNDFLSKLNKMKYLIGSVVLPTISGVLINAESKLDFSNIMDKDTGETMTAALAVTLIGSVISIVKYLKENKKENKEEIETVFPN